MTDPSGSVPTYDLMPNDIEGFDGLAELALDLRWTWNHATDAIWRQLDPALWESTQNPWVILQTVSRDHLRASLADADFRKNVDDFLRSKRERTEEPAWFQEQHPTSPLTCVAYFSMEFMLSEALPIYSGGLGNVAGDQLKAASDLGVPVIGIGLLYQQGYFRQSIASDGSQTAYYPYNDPGQLPISPLRRPNGEWLRLEIPMPGSRLWLRVWQAQVGKVRLYLLDSNDPTNAPFHRTITGELYGGGPELRLMQELLLGIGGWRLIEALDLKPEVCHLNEGHAAFAVLERARSYMREASVPFETALAVTRAGNLFTTHTAVAAGFDRFTPALIAQYLGEYARQDLGMSLRDFLALGRVDTDNAAESFNMAYLAIRGSGAVNAVSQLHGKVSRQLFESLFPRWPQREVPVSHVTNGIHAPAWDSAEADALWTSACGQERLLGSCETTMRDIRGVTDQEIWKYRTAKAQSLVTYARARLAQQLKVSGSSDEAVDRANHLFNPEALTLGFARRFATYKRPDLLLYDRDRLLRLLSDKDRPVQLIIAGKAHPEDTAGQTLIQEWVRFIRQPEVRPHVIFLSDYDMRLTAHLVQGVDVWLNTPRRPWEACGTSGMKVLVNGGINVSELDGWWVEAFTPDVGWALGDGKEHGGDPSVDAAEANALYELLEREVIPQFYQRNDVGIPTAWVQRMRDSMSQLTARFSATRAVREYTEQHYLPAATAFQQRAANQGAIGKQIAAWRVRLDNAWPGLHFGVVSVRMSGDQNEFEVEVCHNDLDALGIRVELYADDMPGHVPERHEMQFEPGRFGASGGCLFRAALPAGRPATDYTARLMPFHDGVAVPLEESRILWQR